MYMLIRLPLGCFSILLYTFLYYQRKEHLHTRTSRAFQWLAVMSLAHLAAAVVTEYTVNTRERVSEAFNYVWHLIFLISLTCVCALLYYYLILYVERGSGRRQQTAKVALLAVCALGILGEHIQPNEYVDTPQGSYSLGPKAYCLYGVVGYVMVMMLFTLVRCRRTVGQERSNVLLASVAVFGIVAAVQMVWPHILLTGLAVTLIVLGIMVNTEDTHLYVSYRTGLYNELGYQEIIQEFQLLHKSFQVAVYTFVGNTVEVEAAMLSVKAQLPEKTAKVICAAIADNTLAVIPMRGLTAIAPLPARMPAPGQTGGHVKYTVEVLTFDGEDTVPAMLSAVRGVKDRFEADQMQRDELTGLLRRNAFTLWVEYILTSGQDFTFLMVDLDDFKSINDVYGHKAGDEVLKGTAEAIRGALRGGDVLCRRGGDEFAIALTGVTDPARVREIAGRIQKSLEHVGVGPDGQAPVKVSLGARICGKEGRASSFQELYVAADAALYRAKGGGKDRLCFAPDERARPDGEPVCGP